MNTPEEALTFAENFAKVPCVSDSALAEDGSLIHELNDVNFRPFITFLSIVVLALPFVMFSVGADVKLVAGVPIAVAITGVCVVGVLWLVNQSHLNANLPSIDKDTDELVLPSGSRFSRLDIEQFRQFDCKTKISNFRLALTSVVTRDKKQFAVCVEHGTLPSAFIGKQIAEYFEAEVENYPTVISSPENLRAVGVQ